MANSLVNGPVQGETPAPSKPEQPATAVWMYRDGESRLFASPSDVPKGQGWVDSPALVKPGKKNGDSNADS